MSPPLINVFTLNATEVPVQKVVCVAEIVTDGTTKAFTVIVTTLLVTVVGTGQVALEVISTFT